MKYLYKYLFICKENERERERERERENMDKIKLYINKNSAKFHHIVFGRITNYSILTIPHTDNTKDIKNGLRDPI